jgi:hypothetical protein
LPENTIPASIHRLDNVEQFIPRGPERVTNIEHARSLMVMQYALDYDNTVMLLQSRFCTGKHIDLFAVDINLYQYPASG